jgi:hypothetical protein
MSENQLPTFDPAAALSSLKEKESRDTEMLKTKIVGLEYFAGRLEAIKDEPRADLVVCALDGQKAVLQEIGFSQEIALQDSYLSQEEADWVQQAQQFLIYVEQHPEAVSSPQVPEQIEAAKAGIQRCQELNEERKRESLDPTLAAISAANTSALRVARRELASIENDDPNDPLRDPALNAEITRLPESYESLKTQTFEDLGAAFEQRYEEEMSLGICKNVEAGLALIKKQHNTSRDRYSELGQAWERLNQQNRELNSYNNTRKIETLEQGFDLDGLPAAAAEQIKDLIAKELDRYRTGLAALKVVLDENFKNIQEAIENSYETEEERQAALRWLRENFIISQYPTFVHDTAGSFHASFVATKGVSAPKDFEPSADKEELEHQTLPSAYNKILLALAKSNEWLGAVLADQPNADGTEQNHKIANFSRRIFLRQMLQELVSGEEGEDKLERALVLRTNHQTGERRLHYRTEAPVASSQPQSSKRKNVELLGKIKADKEMAAKIFAALKMLNVDAKDEYGALKLQDKSLGGALRLMYKGAFTSADSWNASKLHSLLPENLLADFREKVGAKRLEIEKSSTDLLVGRALRGLPVEAASVVQANEVLAALRDRLIPHLVAAEEAGAQEAQAHSLTAAEKEASQAEVRQLSSSNETAELTKVGLQEQLAAQNQAFEAESQKRFKLQSKLQEARRLLDATETAVDAAKGFTVKNQQLVEFRSLLKALKALLPPSE